MPYSYWGLQTDEDDDDDPLFDVPVPAWSFPLPLTLLLPPLPLGSMKAVLSSGTGTPRICLTRIWFRVHIVASSHWQLIPPCALPSL